MKKPWFYILATFLAMSCITNGEAAVVAIGGPGVTLSANQPVQAVVVDRYGNTTQQTIYYDPAICGVNLDTAWAGPNASVYFPEYQTGYVWYNGYWVDNGGYYYDGGRRLYIGHPHWGDFWAGYWHHHWSPYWHGGGWRGGWHGGWHGGYHGGGWHGGGWHGGGGHWHHR